MSSHKPRDAGWVIERNMYARGLYKDAETRTLKGEELIRQTFTLPQEVQGLDLEVAVPAKANNLLTKQMSMLAIRAKKQRRVIPFATESGVTKEEQKKVERLERIIEAAEAEMIYDGQGDATYDATWFALKSGRGPILTTYQPKRKGFKIVRDAPDPLTCFPVLEKERVEWFTREYFKGKLLLGDYYDQFDPQDEYFEFQVPEGFYDRDEISTEMVHVVEYWDEKWHAVVIDNDFFGPFEHDYGFCPLAEIRFARTPELDQGWAFAGLLDPVLEDLKNHARLLTKMQTGIQMFYYPMLIYFSEDGIPQIVNVQAPPGQWQPMMKDTTPLILTPRAANEDAQLLVNMLEREIGEATVPQIVFTDAIPGSNVSGFGVSQVLSLVKDAQADRQHAVERADGVAWGHFLRCMEEFAALEEGYAWKLGERNPKGNRKAIRPVSAADIGGHYRVEVKISAALPQDILQKTTIYNNIRHPDPVTGMASVSVREALRISGLIEDIEDEAAMWDDIEWEFAQTKDPELQTLMLESIIARNSRRVNEMRRDKKRRDRSEQRRLEKEALDDFDAGEDESLVIPPDRKYDAPLLHRMAALVEQGQDPMLAFEELPQGVPGEMGGQPDPAAEEETRRLMQMMEGVDASEAFPGQPGARIPDELRGGRMPNSLTGYAGINPEQLAPASQGALPRQSVDQDRVALEQVELDQQRGALPAPK